MKVVVINFAKHQKLPEGYEIQWWESSEMYQWVKKGYFHTNSVSFCNRWMAYRNAWANFKANEATND